MARNLILGALVAVAAFGCATSPSQKSSADTHADKKSLQATANETCVRDTGTRIKRPDDRLCNGLPGSTYTEEQIENTGRLDTADALRQLDPRIQ